MTSSPTALTGRFNNNSLYLTVPSNNEDDIGGTVKLATSPTSCFSCCNKDLSLREKVSTLSIVALDQTFKELAKLNLTVREKGFKRIFKHTTYDSVVLAYAKAVEQNNPAFIKNYIDTLISRISDSTRAVPQVRMYPAVAYDAPRANTLDNLMLAFNYFSADHTPEGPWEAVQTLQIYAVLAATPFIVSSVFEDLLHEHTPLRRLDYFYSVIICMAVGYGLLKGYQKYKPIPTEIRPLRNFTVEALKGNLEPLLGRDDVIRKIFLCWDSTRNIVRQHPLLVGPAGVGKTVIFMEIARRIAIGAVPDSMKGLFKNKIMFGGSSALLLPDQGGMQSADVLERFVQRTERYKEKIILGLDEIHSLLKEQSKQREVVKSLLDTSTRGYPFILSATTDFEYKQYIAGDPALARRFVVIYVKPLDKDQVILSLRELMRRQYPGISASEEVLAYLYESTEAIPTNFPNVPKQRQPEISVKILTQALSTISQKQEEPNSLFNLQSKQIILANLQSQYLTTLSEPTSQTNIAEKIKNISTQINDLELKVEEETKKLTKYKIINEEIASTQEKILDLASRIEKSNDRDRQELKAYFVFLYKYVLENLTKSKRDIEKELYIPTLGEELIKNQIGDFCLSISSANTSQKNSDTSSKDEEV